MEFLIRVESVGKVFGTKNAAFWPTGELRFFLGRDVLGGECSTFTKKIFFHLLDQEFLVLFRRGIQPIFIQQNLAMFYPQSPGITRDMFENALSQFAVEGRLVQSGQLLLEFLAENSAIDWLRGHRRR